MSSPAVLEHLMMPYSYVLPVSITGALACDALACKPVILGPSASRPECLPFTIALWRFPRKHFVRVQYEQAACKSCNRPLLQEFPGLFMGSPPVLQA